MNILSYTNCLVDPKLGSGKTVLMFSQGMRQLGHTVDVCSPKDYEAMYGLRRAMHFRQAWGSWLSVGQKLKERHYDVLEFYGDEFWLPTWRLSKSVRRPLIVAHPNLFGLLAIERMGVFNPNSLSFRNRLYKVFFHQTHTRFTQMAYAYSDAFVALCERDRQHVLKLGYYPAERTTVVGPGLDEEYLSVPLSFKREERVAFTGSWILRKGVDRLTDVMTRLLTQYPNLYFDVYGTWWARSPVLESFPPKVRSQIVVHPELSNIEMADYLTKAKVFFFPTQYEAFGIALAEAMACGCAAVTTPTGFGADLCSEKEAIICDFDDVHGMEQSVLRLLKDDNLRENIASKGLERARSLRWEVSAKKLEVFYGKWLEDYKNRIMDS